MSQDTGGADSWEKDVSPVQHKNPGPSAAPLFLTDTSELAQSLPLVHEHERFQGVEDAGWETGVASHEHSSLQIFSSWPHFNKVLEWEVIFTLQDMCGILWSQSTGIITKITHVLH